MSARWLDADVIKIKRKPLLFREFTTFGGKQTCPYIVEQTNKTVPWYVQGAKQATQRSGFTCTHSDGRKKEEA